MPVKISLYDYPKFHTSVPIMINIAKCQPIELIAPEFDGEIIEFTINDPEIEI